MPFPIFAVTIAIAGGALALTGSMLAGRKQQREVERRLSLVEKVAPDSAAGAASAAPWANKAGKLDEFAEKFFTFGAGYSWGMDATSRELAIWAAVCAGGAWLLTTAGFGLPVWFAVPACAAAAFFGPRGLHTRMVQANPEMGFPEFFRQDRDGQPRGVIRVVKAGRS